MKTLRVLIPDHWPDQPEAHWTLLEDNGQILGEGLAEPRHWPQSERTEIVLSGSQIGWHTVRMPRASVREQAKSLGFAVEEHLLREPDSQHSTPTLQGDEAWSVLVVARERLRRLAAQFQTLNRPLDGAYSALANLPWEPGCWSLAVDGTNLLVRTGANEGFTDDLPPDGEAPFLIAAALEQAQAAGSLPQAIHVFAGNRSETVWAATLHHAVEQRGEWAWYKVDGGANLLHGEFAARHRTDAWLKHLKPAVAVLLCVFLADLLLGGIEIGLRRSELNAVKADMTRLLKSQLPGAAVLDPALQLRRELNLQRQAHGQFSDDAPMTLLAGLAVALGAEGNNAVAALRYESGSLSVSLSSTGIDLPGLIQRLATQGIQATRREGDGIQLVLSRSST